MGPSGNRGSWGPWVLAHTQTTPKKAYERYQGHLMGPPTDPGPRAVPLIGKIPIGTDGGKLQERRSGPL
ncbi:unnamed protein product, partial [Staurois parvus]